MLNEFLPELEVVEVNRRGGTYQFICHEKSRAHPVPIALKAHIASIADTSGHCTMSVCSDLMCIYGFRQDASFVTNQAVPQVSLRRDFLPCVDHTPAERFV